MLVLEEVKESELQEKREELTREVLRSGYTIAICIVLFSFFSFFYSLLHIDIVVLFSILCIIGGITLRTIYKAFSTVKSIEHIEKEMRILHTK